MRDWLKQLRVIRGKTEKQVAQESGISQPFYHYVETGQKTPSPDVAQAISEALGFDWTRFYPRKARKTG